MKTVKSTWEISNLAKNEVNEKGLSFKEVLDYAVKNMNANTYHKEAKRSNSPSRNSSKYFYI